MIDRGTGSRYSGIMKYQFNPRRIPWSSPGSVISISERPQASDSYRGSNEETDRSLYLRSVSAKSGAPELFALEPAPAVTRTGAPDSLDFQAEALPYVLTLMANDGTVELCFDGPSRLLVRGQGVALRLARREWRPFDHVVRISERTAILHAYKNRLRIRLWLEHGSLRIDAPWERVRCPRALVDLVPDESGVLSASMEFSEDDFPQDVPTIVPFADTITTQRENWDAWLARHDETDEEPIRAAAYLNWSSIVGPVGILKRPTMYMSKFKMTNCWGWDHCFNAIAYARRHPELAWNQFITFFEHANEHGMIPGSINDVMHNWVPKPPVHGWAFDLLLEANPSYFEQKIDEVVGPLAQWTDWWFTHRDYNRDGCPQYDHGNDSGWDNATSFHRGPGVDSPDLTAFLAYQSRVVARLARRSGDHAVSRRNDAQADRLEHLLMERFWDGTQFRGRQMQTDDWVPGDSLLNFMPVVLGEHLPPEVQQKLASALADRSRFRTQWGLATESIASDFYDPYGYWRGPIWAPSTLIVIDGLRRMGRSQQAGDLARDFCRLVENGGFAENFHAATGAPLRDPTYTWTSSTYLYLRENYMKGGE